MFFFLRRIVKPCERFIWEKMLLLFECRSPSSVHTYRLISISISFSLQCNLLWSSHGALWVITINLQSDLLYLHEEFRHWCRHLPFLNGSVNRVRSLSSSQISICFMILLQGMEWIKQNKERNEVKKPHLAGSSGLSPFRSVLAFPSCLHFLLRLLPFFLLTRRRRRRCRRHRYQGECLWNNASHLFVYFLR